jgi:copper homeostasis protein
MPRILEVIVTTAAEAISAEAGGADRLELVRDLASGGLTPDLDVVSEVIEAVSIPVRVMLRKTASMHAGSNTELETVRAHACEMAHLPVNGFVAGFIRAGEIDLDAMRCLLEPVPNIGVTFHRAFDEVVNPLRAIQHLKTIGRIDRILTSGGEGDWPCRKRRLLEWQRAASPEITVLVAAGLDPCVLEELNSEPLPFEFHVGRAARKGHQISNPIDREQIASLKSLIQ